MPAQTSKSTLSTMLGKKGQEAHSKVKGNETRAGIVNLPAGIKNGIAQLVGITFGQYGPDKKYKNQPYVQFSSVVVIPDSHGATPVKGLRASLNIPLCDTPDKKNQEGNPKTLKENYDDFLNELRKLGLDTDKLETVDDAENAAAALVKAAPYTRFSTRGWTPPATTESPNPEEMVFVSYNGAVDYSSNGQAPAVTDNTPEAPAEEPAEAAPESDEVDLDALAETASGPTEDPATVPAQAKLQDIATAAGVDEEEFSNAKTWPDAVELIRAAQGNNEGGDDTPADEPWTPKLKVVKGDEEAVVYYPVDLKTKKKVSKGVDCIITAVDAKTKTCTLKSMKDGKTSYAKVAWSELTKES